MNGPLEQASYWRLKFHNPISFLLRRLTRPWHAQQVTCFWRPAYPSRNRKWAVPHIGDNLRPGAACVARTAAGHCDSGFAAGLHWNGVSVVLCV